MAKDTPSEGASEARNAHVRRSFVHSAGAATSKNSWHRDRSPRCSDAGFAPLVLRASIPSLHVVSLHGPKELLLCDESFL